MSLILNIETSSQRCSVALGYEEKCILIEENEKPRAHAAQITLMTEEVIQKAGCRLTDLKAVAISSGPGSFTGLRIGTSAAKGICYAMEIPLIAISTLKALAIQVKGQTSHKKLAPVIPARKGEVYTAIYNDQLEELKAPFVIKTDSLNSNKILTDNMLVFGPGIENLLVSGNNFPFKLQKDIFCTSRSMIPLSFHDFKNDNFSALNTFKPHYLQKNAFKPKERGI